jgi:hypothetical protein
MRQRAANNQSNTSLFSHILVFIVLLSCFAQLCSFQEKSNRSSLTRQGLTLFHVGHQVFVRTLPCLGGLRHHLTSRGSGSYLPAREGSDTATCPVATDPTSTLGRASAPPRVMWLWIPPPLYGGLQRRHVSHGFGLHLLAQEGSGIATCPTAICQG